MSDPRASFPSGSADRVRALGRNLLDANTAHNLQASPFTSSGVADDEAYWSGKCLAYPVASASTVWPRPTDDQPATAGTEYAAEWLARVADPADWTKIVSLRISINWLAGGSSNGISNGAVISSPTAETLLTVTGEAPAGTDEARIYVTLTTSDAVTVHFGNMSFRTGADSTFYPSWRVVGNLELEATIAPDLWVPTTSVMYLIEAWDGTAGFVFYLNKSGGLTCRFAKSGDTRTEGSTFEFAGLPNNEIHRVGVQYDTDSGLVNWLADGEVFNTDTCATGTALRAVTGAVNLGVALEGDLFDATIRDGIGGPAVMRFEAGGLLEAVA